MGITVIDLSCLSLRIEASSNGARKRLLHACHVALHNIYAPGRHPTPGGISSEIQHGHRHTQTRGTHIAVAVAHAHAPGAS